MTFYIVGLTPHDQFEIQIIQKEIINALDNAVTNIKAGDHNCKKWFGDDSKLWINQLKRKLNRMVSIILIQPIEIHGPLLYQQNQQSALYAQAVQPSDGWQDYTSPTGNRSPLENSLKQLYRINLHQEWHTMPLFSDVPNLDNKFLIIAHEVSHLLVSTEDICYGTAGCCALAILDSISAKSNADNWAYFIQYYIK